MKKAPNPLVIEKLQQQILMQQGNKAYLPDATALGLGFIENAFPGKVFAKGAIHEFISQTSEAATCTSGFISVVLNKLIAPQGYCIWVSTVPRRSIFPPALKLFGIDAERILFIDTPNQKQTLWVLEEALKCSSVTAVVGELTEVSFNDSRRLQLAVEKSQVTGFIHRFQPKTENTVACVSRWKITPRLSHLSNNAGVGFPSWHVQLLKVRNGRPDEWLVEWSPNGLIYKQNETEQTTIFEKQYA